MGELQDMLITNNPFVPLYKQAYQVMRDSPAESEPNLQMTIVLEQGADHRRYNLPTVDEVAAIIPGTGEENVDLHRDIVLRYKHGGIRNISHLHPLYHPLHYVLLFPKGDQGWHRQIETVYPQDGAVRSKFVSQRCYFAFRLHPRPMEPSDLFRGGRLLQQYMVDAWASIEDSELHWVRNNQKTIRSDLYDGLRDALRHDPNVQLGERGKRIVLPASHPGSTRHMYQLFQDSMAIARHCGKPDIFLTMTANPSWPEIDDNLFTYEDDDDNPDQPRKRQTPSDRPDIVARVFAQKIKAMLKDIKDGLFGDVQGFVFTIEFQKHGLPHIHLLIFLKQRFKIRDAAHVNSIVSAQIPDPVAHPTLYATVTKCMMHGPCGQANKKAPCMVDGKCSKHYPKVFCSETRYGDDGYPEYARPDNGRTYANPKGQTFDNRNVVPYNPFLSARYDCHINVEICASVKAIKYIHKYIYKGHDRATVVVGKDIDEISDYIGAHYVGSAEGCWHMMEFPMHEEKPTVYRLPVHLKDKHNIHYDEDDDPEELLDDEALKKTPLTEWFIANSVLPDAKDVTYHDFPQKFIWEKKARKWKTHSQCEVIGRMYFVHPKAGERFYLRTLLTIVKGAESWEDLRRHQGQLHTSFKAACFARGLLEDDGEWRKCLQEAGHMQTGHQLRCLFAIILLHCHPAQPHILWDLNKAKLCDDLRHRLIARGHLNPTDDNIFDYGLYLLEHITIKADGKRLSDIQDMYTPQQQWGPEVDNPIL